MATKTTNYNLIKPGYEEMADIEPLNNNADTIDTELKKNANNLTEHLAESVSDIGGVHGLDIESGSFTPIVVGLTTTGDNAYSTQRGSYYKAGKKVYISLVVTMTTKDVNMSGVIAVKGLPFSTIEENFSLAVGSAGGIKFISGFTFLGAWTNIDEIRLSKLGSITTPYLKADDIEDTFHLKITGEYLIN